MAINYADTETDYEDYDEFEDEYEEEIETRTPTKRKPRGAKINRSVNSDEPLSGLSVAGLVCGIVAVLGSLIPLLNIITFPMVILAIVFGGVGMYQTIQGGKRGKKLAIAALVLGILAFIITFTIYPMIASQAMSSAYYANGY